MPPVTDIVAAQYCAGAATEADRCGVRYVYQNGCGVNVFGKPVSTVLGLSLIHI